MNRQEAEAEIIRLKAQPKDDTEKLKHMIANIQKTITNAPPFTDTYDLKEEIKDLTRKLDRAEKTNEQIKQLENYVQTELNQKPRKTIAEQLGLTNPHC